MGPGCGPRRRRGARTLGARRHRFAGRQRGSVFLHLLSLAGLVLVAAWQGDVVVLGGGALLLVSHLVLAHDRFCLERRWAPVLVMVAYHAALVLLVIGLVGGGTFGR